MKLESFSLMPASRSLRHTSGSEGISGDVQMTRMFLNLSGAFFSMRLRFSELFAAASTSLLATDRALASWFALRTVLKHSLGSMFLAEKMNVVGTRKPEVELGSPMPKLRLLSHLRMSSTFWKGESLWTRMCPQ